MEWKIVKDDIPFPSTFEFHKDRGSAPHIEQPFHIQRLEAALTLVKELVPKFNEPVLVDLGAGDGGFLSWVSYLFKPGNAIGYDFTPANALYAKEVRNQIVHCINFVDNFDELRKDANIVIMTEVLEHMQDPHHFLKKLYLSTSAKYMIISSPVLETDLNHAPEHVWAWDFSGYVSMATAAGWRIGKHIIAGYFQVCLLERD